MTAVEVITPSYNKGKYISGAIKSVLQQTFTDWNYTIIENSTDTTTRSLVHSFIDPRITIIDEDIPEELRRSEYMTAVLLNRYMPQMKGDLIFYLSDDDMFMNNCFSICVDFMRVHQEAQVGYFSMIDTREDANGYFNQISERQVSSKWPVGSNMDCMLDGGEVFFRRSVLDTIEQPYFVTDLPNAAHCDGLFLNKISSKFAFYPVPPVLLTHRRTRLSTWVKA